MRHTITVSGGFHNSQGLTVRPEIMPDGRAVLSARQMRKINNHLCGISGCMCGIRSSADWESDTIDIDLDGAEYDDGSIMIGVIN